MRRDILKKKTQIQRNTLIYIQMRIKKGTIHGLKFATVEDAENSVKKIDNSGKSHAHKIQAAIAMEQRAKSLKNLVPPQFIESI